MSPDEIKELQRSLGLAPTGLLDTQTVAALRGAGGPPRQVTTHSTITGQDHVRPVELTSRITGTAPAADGNSSFDPDAKPARKSALERLLEAVMSPGQPAPKPDRFEGQRFDAKKGAY